MNFFEDKKIKALKGKYGLNGVMAYIYMLCQIYKESYYVEVDEDFISCMSDDLNISENATRQILKYLFSRSLLCEIKDSKLAKSVTIVTSKSIQRRYQEAKNDGKRNEHSRAIFVKAEYWMLEKSETYGFIKVRQDENKSPINSDKSPIYGTKESKVNEIKVNESKVDKPPAAASCSRDDLIKDYGIAAVNEYERRFEEWKAKQGAINANKYAVISKMLYEDYKLGKSKSNLSKGENSSFDIAEIEEFLKGKNKAND